MSPEKFNRYNSHAYKAQGYNGDQGYCVRIEYIVGIMKLDLQIVVREVRKPANKQNTGCNNSQYPNTCSFEVHRPTSYRCFRLRQSFRLRPKNLRHCCPNCFHHPKTSLNLTTSLLRFRDCC